MSIPKKGKHKIGARPGNKAYDYHEDSVRNKAKRKTDEILRRLKKSVGAPITQKVKAMSGGKAKTSLTKRHNKQK